MEFYIIIYATLSLLTVASLALIILSETLTELIIAALTMILILFLSTTLKNMEGKEDTELDDYLRAH